MIWSVLLRCRHWHH